MNEIPDLQWCSERSKSKGIAIRCPFATVESCPRYYQSVSLLGNAGSTAIPIDEDERLFAKWKASELWPRSAEYETSISGWEGKASHFSNFCPEVAFDRFGYFATYLGRYADEIDSDAGHDRLTLMNVPPNDPHWSWASISPQHYTECSIYSVLMHRAKTKGQFDIKPEPPWWRRHLREIILGVVITVIGGLLLKLFGA